MGRKYLNFQKSLLVIPSVLNNCIQQDFALFSQNRQGLTVSILCMKKIGGQGGRELSELNIIHDHGNLNFFSSFWRANLFILGVNRKLGSWAPLGFSFSFKKKMISQEGFWFGSDANMVKLGFCTQRSTFDQFCSKKLNQSILYQKTQIKQKIS